MHLNIQGHTLFADIGGVDHQAGRPTAVFIHGVLNDHRVWLAVSQQVAQWGWNVLALDLPGHGKSDGPAPSSVEAAADTVVACLDALGITQAALIGHSWGSLIALDAAARDAALHPDRVGALVMVGTAYPMRVSPALLELSVSDPLKAIEKITRYSHAPNTDDGIVQANRRLMQDVHQRDPAAQTMHTGFLACDQYRGAEVAVKRLNCRTNWVLGHSDQMTPATAAHALIKWAPHPTVVMVEAGHAIMSEAPQALAQALHDALKGLFNQR
jgi:pimeloyl-ACP methyl ester carboxylesterase